MADIEIVVQGIINITQKDIETKDGKRNEIFVWWSPIQEVALSNRH